MICRLLEGDNRKMKQYGKGSNKSRFLVLSLIIILIIVPFLSHTGYEGETKAKSGKTQAIVCKNLSSLNHAVHGLYESIEKQNEILQNIADNTKKAKTK